MKYIKSGTFTTRQFSIDETLDEIDDVVTIALDCIKNGDLKLAEKNLKQVMGYLANIRHKVKIALKHVPESVKDKEFL
jgi:hypothetical protein